MRTKSDNLNETTYSMSVAAFPGHSAKRRRRKMRSIKYQDHTNNNEGTKMKICLDCKTKFMSEEIGCEALDCILCGGELDIFKEAADEPTSIAQNRMGRVRQRRRARWLANKGTEMGKTDEYDDQKHDMTCNACGHKWIAANPEEDCPECDSNDVTTAFHN